MNKLRLYSFLFGEWCKIHYQAGILPSIKEFRRICRAYSAEGRFYHTLQHIAECIRFVNIHYGSSGDTFLVKFALFYHDIVYDVKRKDNEELSGVEWSNYSASSGFKLAQMGGSRIVENLILMTAKHRLEPNAPLLFQMMNDADMHVFLCPDHHYLEYAHNVWLEYRSVGSEEYLQGRLAFLDGLDPDTIFYTHQARELSHHAKANIDLEKTILRDQPERIITL